MGMGTQSHSSPGAQRQPNLPLPTACEILPERHREPPPPSLPLPAGWHLLQRHPCPLAPRIPGPVLSLGPQDQASAPVQNPCNCPQTGWAARALGFFSLTTQPREAPGFVQPRQGQGVPLPRRRRRRCASRRCVKIYFDVENKPPKTVWLCQTWTGAGSRVRPPDTGLASRATRGGLGHGEGIQEHQRCGLGSAMNHGPAAGA